MTFKDLKREIASNARNSSDDGVKMALHDLKEEYKKRCGKKFLSEDQLLSQCAKSLISTYESSAKNMPPELSKYERKYRRGIATLKRFVVPALSLESIQNFIESHEVKTFEEAENLIKIYHKNSVHWEDLVSAWELLNMEKIK